MKGLKFSAFITAVALLLPSAAIAQTDEDDAYLSQLYGFLQSQDAVTHAMATESMSPEDSIWAAQMFCRTFDAGVAPADAFTVYTASAVSQATSQGVDMTEEMAYAVGLYGGAVMNVGSMHYCPQHQPQVEQALQSL
ncbi:MAG: hypothetical protein AAFQ74_03370 [Cyanobacteria bacterium J06623_4]